MLASETTTTQASIPSVPALCVFAPAMMDLCGQHSSGAAQRRKQRRLRSWWRHEHQSIAAALATSLHHSSRGQRKARAGEEESELHCTAKFRTTPPPQPVLFSLYDEEPSGRWPASLAEPPGPLERVQRHTMEHIVDFVCFAPTLQILDAPVPQTVEQLPDILRFFDTLMPDLEQLIEVPKILPSPRALLCVNRSWWNSWWKCRLSCLLPCRST